MGRDEIDALLAEEASGCLSPAQEFEKRRLHDLLEESNWDVKRTAALLGVHRGSLYRRMKHFGIQSPRSRRTLANYGETSRVIRMRQRATSRDLAGPGISEVVESQ